MIARLAPASLLWSVPARPAIGFASNPSLAGAGRPSLRAAESPTEATFRLTSGPSRGYSLWFRRTARTGPPLRR